MRGKYDTKFKEMVAKEAVSINNISATAKKYDVNSNTVSKWIKSLEKSLGMGEIQKADKFSNEKEGTQSNREVLDLKIQLKNTQNDLNEAMIIIGEKNLHIKKLEKSLR
ncbi:transposase [Solibacillus cecembensis]|uniref:transposase n=1 Tax=Solibacillus cecembensis TaxID=459347 RepID=UPI003CFE3595